MVRWLSLVCSWVVLWCSWVMFGLVWVGVICRVSVVMVIVVSVVF